MTSIKGRYARIEISLNDAKSDEELHLSGDYISIVAFLGPGSCKIKLDHRHSQEIDLREISSISGVFERIYLTTDGEGGTCTLFVGNGLAIHIAADAANLWNGTASGTQGTTLANIVGGLSSEPFKLNDVTILNMNGIYACYVGTYTGDVDLFRDTAYLLLPHKTLKFATVDMYSLGAVSYDGVHNVVLSIIGTYE